ncbi:MBL fold metallo-hydrolase [Sphingomonas corticis]|uniref:MBL fold metallo-hydrolase n=1 Tax=Sphingomonas corticis TaxID=2722791 RepID=A0ABX1CUF9_9SPHN|nr:MBL fold metallo-hydrolase [Sphingomonas corticis]NJR80268.1 MBL fold metallo-hydrolase [Sphingomonas corticis]
MAAVLLACAGQVATATDVTPSARVVRGVVVRERPTTASAPVGGLRPGDKAVVVEDLPGWWRVRLPDGATGYVSKAWTVVVAEAPPSQPLSATAPTWKVHVIDVGTGLAVFVEGPGFAMLYDAGSQDDLAMGRDNRVVAYIHAVRPDLTTLDHVVLSHPHKDHVELMPDVFDRYAVRDVWDSGALNPTRGYCRFLKKVLAEPGVRYHDAIATGGVRLAVFPSGECKGRLSIPQSTMMTADPIALGPGASMSILYRNAERHSDPNENTVVVRLDLGGYRILLAGDAEAGGRDPVDTPPTRGSIEWSLLGCCKAALKADVLIVGHHGSLTSSRRPFLDAVGASIFVISSGPHPYQSVQLPDAGIVTELRGRGQVFSTKEGDEECLTATAKVGPDEDESPGGCTNVLVTVGPLGVGAAVVRPAD